MSYRVDLLYESERRSGSVFSIKALIRLVGIIVPAIIITAASVWGADVMRQTNEAKMLESQWTETKPKKDAANALRTEALKTAAIQSELQGWANAHVNWHRCLFNIQRAVPAAIQIESLRVKQALLVVPGKGPSRMFSVTLRGRAKGETSEHSVLDFKRTLAEGEVFGGHVKEVTVPVFGADSSPDADKFDRIFEVHCELNPYPFQ